MAEYDDNVTLPVPPDEKEMREHKHWETGPAVTSSAPANYPRPKAGKVTRWTLTTPEKEAVGVLVFNEGGVAWTPAAGASLDAQEYGDEILGYLQGHKAADIALEDTLDGIKDAYTGDLTEDSARFIPAR